MNKRVKNVLIFAGGVSIGAIAGGIGVAYRFISSKTFGPAIAKVTAEKIVGEVFEPKRFNPKRHTPKTFVEYREYYKVKDMIFDTRGEAEDVLTRMYELLDTYDVVHVADLYDLVAMDSMYKDNKYGWINLNRSEVKREGDKYRLVLPRPYLVD